MTPVSLDYLRAAQSGIRPWGGPAGASLSRRRFLALAGTSVLAGCAGMPPVFEGGPPAESPAYRVGDRWVHHAWDGFRTPVVWDETTEILAVAPEGITARVTQKGPSTNNTRTEQWAAPGLVRVGAVFDEETRRFEVPLKRFVFPLTPGETWNQWVNNYNEERREMGDINRYGRVGGWRKIASPAGTFDAIGIQIVMHLDDEEFWRRRTDCTYLVWYAPAVRGVVREEKEAQYYEKGGRDVMPVRSQHSVVELVSFTPGPG